MQNTLLVVAAVLLLSNAVTMYYVYRLKIRLGAEEESSAGCVENVRYLERQVFEVELEKQKLEYINTELAKSNRYLKAKIDKINTQVRQISDHFKTN